MSINLPLPLLGEMAIFVKVVETGSFSEAARQLGSSPSAVSRSISRLEKALATRLLQRTTRKLRLERRWRGSIQALPGDGQRGQIGDGNQWSVHP